MNITNLTIKIAFTNLTIKIDITEMTITNITVSNMIVTKKTSITCLSVT